jgi:hypothetical protein
MRAEARTHPHARAHSRAHTHTRAPAPAHTRTPAHTRMRAYTHACSHTHTAAGLALGELERVRYALIDAVLSSAVPVHVPFEIASLSDYL